MVSLNVRPSRPGAVPCIETRDLIRGAHPQLWLGAPAQGGLALPAAMPTADQLYAPRGVWLDEQRLIVADTGNHRVLIWHDIASAVSHAPADVVLGQPDFSSEGAQASGRGPRHGMRLPTGVLVHEGRLVVADAWNHRLLVWDSIPQSSGCAAGPRARPARCGVGDRESGRPVRAHDLLLAVRGSRWLRGAST